jgi:rubrerythrin
VFSKSSGVCPYNCGATADAAAADAHRREDLLPDPGKPAPEPPPTRRSAAESSDKVLCERCGAEMFRMHAVWRCPACGYKTDCCGW